MLELHQLVLVSFSQGADIGQFMERWLSPGKVAGPGQEIGKQTDDLVAENADDVVCTVHLIKQDTRQTSLGSSSPNKNSS